MTESNRKPGNEPGDRPADTLDTTRKRLCVATFALLALACSSGPPKPLAERPGEGLPVWVTESGAESPLPQPQTRGRNDVFPAEIRALGQAMDEDAVRGAELAAADARRTLRYHLDSRIRRAMLLWLDKFADESSDQRALRERVWGAEGLTSGVRDEWIRLTPAASDRPPEVDSVPLHLVDAAVDFTHVLDAARAAFRSILRFDVSQPDRRTLARLLTAERGDR